MQKTTYRANSARHVCLRGGFAMDSRFIFAGERLGMGVRVAGAGWASASRKAGGALWIWNQLDQH